MRSAFLSCVICISLVNVSYSQNRTNVWMLSGVDTPDPFPLPGIKFNNWSLDTFTVNRILKMFITNVSICDTSGKLLFYSNGRFIANNMNDSLLNCDKFNSGYGTDTSSSNEGLGLVQGMIIIPHPDSEFLYDLFYESFEPVQCGSLQCYYPFHLSHSIIDMRLDNGLGAMTVKNDYVIMDTLLQGYITACKHGNGRDWWIISHKWNSNRFYKLLVTPTGILGPFIQEIGVTFYHDYGFGQACFSPDGSKYVLEINDDSILEYLDFDRCSGDFSNSYSFLNHGDPFGLLGCQFSPNSRYLYTSSLLQVNQYDTQQDSFFNHPETVAIWDSSYLPGPSWFFLMQLGPDNRIYISTEQSTNTLTYIDEPDSIGKKCDVVQHGVVFSFYNNESVPYFPNYDLGSLVGSGCDTISTLVNSVKNVHPVYKIYPNPARDWVNIVYNSQQDATFELYDLYGRKAAEQSLYHYFKNRMLNVGSLVSGVYGYKVEQRGATIQSGTLAVVK